MTCKDTTDATWTGSSAEFSMSRKADAVTRINFLNKADGSGSANQLKAESENSKTKFELHKTQCTSRGDCDSSVNSITSVDDTKTKAAKLDTDIIAAVA